MLEHQKLVLQNLSGDKELFRKELLKSMKWLKSYELFHLYRWLKNNYADTHSDVIYEVFKLFAA